MFKNVSEKISDNIVKGGFGEDEDRELYLFGIQQGLILLLNIGTTIVIGLLLDTLWELIIFTIALIALKSYSGGYHSKTPQKCYVVSTLMTVAVSLLIKYVLMHTWIYLGLVIIAGMVILIFSPVDSENKPLDELEKRVYRKRAINICIIEILTVVVFLFFNLKKIAICVIWNLVAVSLMMVIAKVMKIFKYAKGVDSRP